MRLAGIVCSREVAMIKAFIGGLQCTVQCGVVEHGIRRRDEILRRTLYILLFN